MIPVPEAIDIVKKEVGAPVAERVPISEAAGRILSEDILADSDLPPFNRSQMDGFAMRHDDDSESLRIIGESVAGRGFDGKVAPGTAVRIMTGARVPEGA
ncbi:MAG: molybdopterin molybdenumtransferase MoeA, partial [Acidobacteriota bacterium]